MSELEEIKIAVTEKELEPVKKLSPTSIGMYYDCPREFYTVYVEKTKVKPNIHLVKGSIVHKVLENFFKEYHSEPKLWLKENFRKEWTKNAELIRNLELQPKDLMLHKRDTFRLVMDFFSLHKRKTDALIENEKAENEHHAFYLVKPKLREMYIFDEELHCAGFIDRIHKDYNNIITLGDYKTSSKFGIGLPEKYRRQLAIYALLYKRKMGVTPDFVAIIFLRYGEEFLIEVSSSLLKYARDSIEYVWNKTRSVDPLDYPEKGGAGCKFCSHIDSDSGEKAFKTKKRIEKIKEMITDEKKTT